MSVQRWICVKNYWKGTLRFIKYFLKRNCTTSTLIPEGPSERTKCINRNNRIRFRYTSKFLVLKVKLLLTLKKLMLCRDVQQSCSWWYSRICPDSLDLDSLVSRWVPFTYSIPPFAYSVRSCTSTLLGDRMRESVRLLVRVEWGER